jgi:hypothetical protein
MLAPRSGSYLQFDEDPAPQIAGRVEALMAERGEDLFRKILRSTARRRPQGALDRELPKPPDVGFFGRDETIYALDRAFDVHRIVLLHAYAGSGKTATAAEFARWYSLTGGVQGPVLLSSFERHLPLARGLYKIGEMFGPTLERSGVQWGAVIDEGQRRQIAPSVLKQIPVLWIWDNVEPITGFPAGTPSDWSEAEQKELRDFLSDARKTQSSPGRSSSIAASASPTCRT